MVFRFFEDNEIALMPSCHASKWIIKVREGGRARREERGSFFPFPTGLSLFPRNRVGPPIPTILLNYTSFFYRSIAFSQGIMGAGLVSI